MSKAARVLGIAPARLLFGQVPTRGEEMEHAPVSIERLQRLLGWSPGLAPGTAGFLVANPPAIGYNMRDGMDRAAARWSGAAKEKGMTRWTHY